MAFVMQSCIQMKRSIRTILTRVWVHLAFYCHKVKPLSPVHRPLLGLQGWRKHSWARLTWAKAGLVLAVEHRASDQCTVQISDGRRHSRPTGSSWLQMVDWFLQSKDKEQVYSFIPGAVLERSWDWKFRVEGRAFFFFLHFSLLSQILLAGSSW